jgi:thioesterase domain-containing protein
MFAALEERTGRRLPMTTLFRASTVATLAELIETEHPVPRWTSLVAVTPGGSRPPMFYVSPFLITALSFTHLGRHLGDDQPFWVLQPQGMEDGHPIHRSVEAMAAHYIEEMRQVQPHGPYHLGGHCAGSTVAFEMARQLRAAGEEVGLLALVDGEPPGIHPPPLNLLRHLASRALYYWRAGRLLDALTWQWGLLVQQYVLRRVGRGRRRRLAELRHVHADAHRHYHAGILDGDALLLRSRESVMLADKDWHLRWSELITGELAVDVVPGGHAALVENANSADLAAALRRALGSDPPA